MFLKFTRLYKKWQEEKKETSAPKEAPQVTPYITIEDFLQQNKDMDAEQLTEMLFNGGGVGIFLHAEPKVTYKHVKGAEAVYLVPDAVSKEALPEDVGLEETKLPRLPT